ncbi:MAG: universal stress protein [Bacteroidales bacterium]|nr:universal stress protein [Bacteroidales bacterium]
MKNVLIALDYDPSAEKVAETGFLLAKSMGGNVTLLHVLADPTYYASMGHIVIMGFSGHLDTNNIPLEKMGDPEKISSLFLEKAKQQLGDINIQTLAIDGDTAEAILNTANDLHIDIIIMGSHSRRWHENKAMGSVTEFVLKRTTIPVIIIPTGKQ